jgi:hypothetical protein
LNTDFGINNERQDCKIGTVCVGGEASGRGRGNEKDEGEGIWLMGSHTYMKYGDETSCNCFKKVGRGLQGGRGDGGSNLTNV